MKLVKDNDSKIIETNKVSDKEAEEAFKTILTWMGEDPNREGLQIGRASCRERV